MREAKFEGPRARRYYHELMSPTERASVDRAIARLEYNTSPDGVTTFEIPGTPRFLYDDGTWQIIYEVPDEVVVLVHSIAHALDLSD